MPEMERRGDVVAVPEELKEAMSRKGWTVKEAEVGTDPGPTVFDLEETEPEASPADGADEEEEAR